MQEEYFKIDDLTSVINYNTKGLECGESDTIVAKHIKSKNSEEFKVAIFAGSIYNPGGGYSHRENTIKNHFKFKNVTKELFNKYIQYLKDRKINSFNMINRRIFND